MARYADFSTASKKLVKQSSFIIIACLFVAFCSFYSGRQQKSSRAGQQNNFFIFQPEFSEEISPKNAVKDPVV